MCSICGVAAKGDAPPDPELVVRMLAATRHRGPDGCGIHAGGKVAYAPTPEGLRGAVAAPDRVVLGQSRLAITGSLAARQPFVSADGRLALAHNGEVYNHRELARELGDPDGVATGCDSEVLVRVLEIHHAATGGNLAEAVARTVQAASGMYALAVTDGRSVVLARDAIGKKPLYYVDGARTLGFSSERKALAEVARAEGAPIRRLLPGEMLVLRPDGVVEHRHPERLSAPAVDVTDAETALAVYEGALRRAVERRTRGLARAAVYFSGGVDSVLVARLVQEAGVEITGYVAGVAGSSDVAVAEDVARRMGIPLVTSLVDEATIARDLPDILRAAELHGPVQAEVSIPMWYSAKAAHADGHRVVFTGQAADELFAGYPWYREVVRQGGGLTLHARMWEDIRALPLDTLEREDRISMAWSLEARAPFLDADVIRAAMRIAPSVKLHGPDDTFGKHPHRALALKLGVPRDVAYRTKAMAQDGANVHELLRAVARRRFPKEPARVEVPDFGSNYRYRDTLEGYGTPEVRALLAAVVAEHGLVVASADGSAVPPPLAPRGAAVVPTARRR